MRRRLWRRLWWRSGWRRQGWWRRRWWWAGRNRHYTNLLKTVPKYFSSPWWQLCIMVPVAKVRIVGVCNIVFDIYMCCLLQKTPVAIGILGLGPNDYEGGRVVNRLLGKIGFHHKRLATLSTNAFNCQWVGVHSKPGSVCIQTRPTISNLFQVVANAINCY